MLFVWLVVAGLTLLVVAVVMRTPAVTEQDILRLLEGPTWKSAKKVAGELRGRKSWISGYLLIWRTNTRLWDLFRKRRLDLNLADDMQWATSEAEFRNIFWCKAVKCLVARDSFNAPWPSWVGKFDVWILHQDFEPKLYGFIGMVGGTIIVSDAVPREDRPFYFLHEVLCMDVWKGQEGHCVRATESEIEAAWREGPQFIRAYLPRRIGFYIRLITYHIARDADQGFLDGLRASSARLEKELMRLVI